MSEFREDLLISPINKKRVIGVFLVTILLISLFAFSVLLYSLLFGSQRPFPSDQLSEAEYEEGNPVFIPIPFNWSDIFDNLNLSQDQLQDLLDSLQDMFDGDIDDLDLGNFSQTILGLLASEIEVFRVFYYSDIINMTNKLWKYECFDEYTGDGWHSTASTQSSNYYSFDDWFNYHSDKDLLKIKMPLTPNLGINSMVIPTLFPNPYIIEGSVFAPNLVLTPPDDPKLYKDDFNSTTMDLTFTSEADVNMSYYMFGLNLPSNDDVNNTAEQAIYTPSIIQNRYLQLPPSINTYLINNYYVSQTYNILNNTISENDNAFVVANKIRNHLQTYFTFPLDPSSYNPAPPGRDAVDWFCETRVGVWSDFASAFCVFCRIFGVASRFVDGFNSFGIQQDVDPIESANYFAIKYKNLYNWAEIYVPSDVSGNGQWVQMDILFDSFGGGGSPITGLNYSLSVFTNLTYPYICSRPKDTVNITAYLSSNVAAPISNMRITFMDVSTNEILGYNFTDNDGEASILLDIDNSKVVGSHVIEARLNPLIANYTSFTIDGEIGVNLTLVDPIIVNRSQQDYTHVQGYVYDKLNLKRVSNVEVNFTLLHNGTNNHVFNPFIPSTQYTDFNGEFNEIININRSIPSGQYEIRVDVNGTFYLPMLNSISNTPRINQSSQRIGLTITKALSVLFYINSYPANNATNPVIFRDDPLFLTARAMLENEGPVQGKRIYFYYYDDMGGSFELGNDISNASGYASITYPADASFTAGPNLLYAKHNLEENYSYFILNEPPILNIFSGPTPREINRTGSGGTNTQFNIEGRIHDATNDNPLRECILRLRLFSQGGSDYSSNLLPSESFYTDFNGYFNLYFEVDSNTPTGNYTLRLDFNGTIDYMWHPIYPYFFTLSSIDLDTSYTFSHQLLISTPATLSFNFWINGTTSDMYNQPLINRGDHLDLSVNVTWGGIPVADGQVITFYDVTQNYPIGTSTTSSGFAQLLYTTAITAGPHQIYANWGSYYNFSYFIVDEQIIVDIDSGPVPREVDRGQTNFNLHGYVNDTLGFPIKYAGIFVHLYDGPTEVSSYLMYQSGSFYTDATGEFDLNYKVRGDTPAQNYTILIEFNATMGGILYSIPPSNNPHNFYLTFPNFYDVAIASDELKVIDPYNLTISLSVEGNPTLPFYDNGNPPETYSFGQEAHFQVQIGHSQPVTGREVRLIDDYTNTLIQSHIFPSSNPFVEFNVSTNDLHAGLNKIRVEYHTFATINMTYVVVNETFTITPSPTRTSVVRDSESFDVNTNVRYGTIDLNGLEITLLLLDSSFRDVSGYLNMAGPQTITVYNGYFQFNINSISLNCPQGQYYIGVAFYGNIFDSGISLFDYMIHVNSSFIPINVIAGTVIIEGSYYTDYDSIYPEYSDQWIINDTLHVTGSLTWDNGTVMQNMYINVTIYNMILGGVIIAYNDTVQTDSFGNFHVTIFIDQNDPWPQYRSESEIWVYFDPVVNGLQYVQGSENNYMS